MSIKYNKNLLCFFIASSAILNAANMEYKNFPPLMDPKTELKPDSIRAIETAINHFNQEKQNFVTDLKQKLDEIKREELEKLNSVEAVELYEDIKKSLDDLGRRTGNSSIPIYQFNFPRSNRSIERIRGYPGALNYEITGEEYRDINRNGMKILENLNQKIKGLLDQIHISRIYSIFLEDPYEDYRDCVLYIISYGRKYQISVFQLKKMLAGEKIYLTNQSRIQHSNKAIIFQKDSNKGIYKDPYEEDNESSILSLVRDQLDKIDLSEEDYKILGKVYDKIIEQKDIDRWNEVIKQYNQDQKLYEIAKKINMSDEEYKYLVTGIDYLCSNTPIPSIGKSEVRKLSLKLLAIIRVSQIRGGLKIGRDNLTLNYFIKKLKNASYQLNFDQFNAEYRKETNSFHFTGHPTMGSGDLHMEPNLDGSFINLKFAEDKIEELKRNYSEDNIAKLPAPKQKIRFRINGNNIKGRFDIYGKLTEDTSNKDDEFVKFNVSFAQRDLNSITLY